MCFPTAIGFSIAAERARQDAIERAQRTMDQHYRDQFRNNVRAAWEINRIRALPPAKRDGEKCPHCGASETRTKASGAVICAYCRSGG